jgi:hypothetical protein
VVCFLSRPDSPVASAPRPLEKQTSIHVRKGQTAVLPCFAEGNPPPAIRSVLCCVGVSFKQCPDHNVSWEGRGGAFMLTVSAVLARLTL